MGKRRINLFARQAARQGRWLPPDLVLASLPPLASAGPAYSLSCFYKVPLIMELREVDSYFIDSRDSLLKKIMYFLVRRNVLKVYCRADSIIVTSPEIAALATQLTSPEKEITVLPDELDYENLFKEFTKILTAVGEEVNHRTDAPRISAAPTRFSGQVDLLTVVRIT